MLIEIKVPQPSAPFMHIKAAVSVDGSPQLATELLRQAGIEVLPQFHKMNSE
jgi:hypothetical protein